MRIINVRSLSALLVAGLASSLCAEDAAKKEIVLPAKFEQGTVHLEGFGGTPGDRSSIRVELRADGRLEVEKKRVRNKPIVRKVQLDAKRSQEFYNAMVKIISETDKKKLSSGSMDGWYVTAKIKTDAGEKSLRYAGFGEFNEISAEFGDISKLINKELPAFSFPE